MVPWRSETTASVRTFQFTCWEVTNQEVISLWERIPVSSLTLDGTTHEAAYATSAQPSQDRRAFIFDAFDGLSFFRNYIPSGTVTARGNVTHVRTGQLGYQMTVTCYADVNVNAIYRTIFTPDLESLWV